MLQLSDGRLLEIRSDRARYHACRRRIWVDAKLPHRRLYPLIDVLLNAPSAAPHRQNMTHFSGHTLGERRWQQQLSGHDRQRLQQWLNEPEQQRVIEMARRRLMAEDSPPLQQHYPHGKGLYSALELRLKRLPQLVAPAQQWHRTLLNLRSDGIRREELDWSGLNHYLKSHPDGAKVTKDLLLEQLHLEHIRPQLNRELTLSTEATLPFRDVVERIPACQLQMAGYWISDDDIVVVRLRATHPSYRVGHIRPQGRTLNRGEAPRWFVLGPFGRVVTNELNGTPLFDSREEAQDAANHHAHGQQHLPSKPIDAHTYEHMTLFGGEGYREWLVTLPQFARSHFTAHYPERNILCHLRTKIRTSQSGHRVLFIEEVQSDWHQALATGGLRHGVPLAPYRREWAAIGVKLLLIHLATTQLDGIAWTGSDVHELRYDTPLPPLRHLYDQTLPKLFNRLARPWGARVGYESYRSRSPWLHAVRCNHKWKVEGGAGSFKTRARYEKDEATALIERHSREINIECPTLILPDGMRNHILRHGLPLYGETHETPE